MNKGNLLVQWANVKHPELVYDGLYAQNHKLVAQVHPHLQTLLPVDRGRRERHAPSVTVQYLLWAVKDTSVCAHKQSGKLIVAID